MLIVTSISVAGDAFFSGFLDAAVGEEQHGHPSRPIGQILRTLPYARLIVVDVLLSFTIAGGSLAFVIPGLVLFTLFCLIGPLINIERLTVRKAFARSIPPRPARLRDDGPDRHASRSCRARGRALLAGLGVRFLRPKALVDGLLAAVVYSIVA